MNRPFVAPLLIVLGSVLILVCGTGPLWFDEIFTFQWAKSAQTPWQLLALYRHDNNHPLNSLWIMMVGNAAPPLLARTLSIISGVVSLVLIHHLARRLSPRFAWVPLLLAATSFPLILYFSEARGYAPAIACLLGACAVRDAHGHPAWRMALFWLLCTLAVLSHGTALVILAALGATALLHGILEKEPLPTLALGLTLWFLIPFVVAAGHWFFFLRQMIVAGGPEFPIPQVLAHFFGYAFGIPGAGAGTAGIAVAGIALLLAGLILGKFPTAESRWFFIFATLVFPAASLLATDPTYLYFRYFLVSLPFVYLLTAPIAERIAGYGRPAAISAGLLLALIVAGQSPRILSLVNQGRGDYLSALRRIVSDRSLPPVIVSNNDLQVGLVVGHLRSKHPDLEPIRFVPHASGASVVPSWILYATQDDPPVEPAPAIDLHGRGYHLVAQHFSAPVSGAHWSLYKLQQP